MRPAVPPNDPPPALPPEIEARLRALSQPGATSDYVLAPPPARTGPDLEAVGSRVSDVVVATADRGLAALAHFAILFGLVGIGFVFSLAITAIIWLRSRRSPAVHFQSRQAGAYQIFVILSHLGFAVLWGFLLAGSVYFRWDWTTALAAALPFVWILWFFLSIAYGALGGLLVLLGRDFRYPVFGRTPRPR